MSEGSGRGPYGEAQAQAHVARGQQDTGVAQRPLPGGRFSALARRAGPPPWPGPGLPGAGGLAPRTRAGDHFSPAEPAAAPAADRTKDLEA
ncbi:hypothetical protein [Streptomyces sp. NPDC059063]|uniref:hypothetical protein n=1 Tax=unclassified Streptomyces TaxID=2593676 RepID=UPI0036A5329C